MLFGFAVIYLIKNLNPELYSETLTTLETHAK